MRSLLPASPLLFVLAVMAVTAWNIDRCPDCGLSGHEPGTPDCPREEA